MNKALMDELDMYEEKYRDLSEEIKASDDNELVIEQEQVRKYINNLLEVWK